jgi:hypothetical protein
MKKDIIKDFKTVHIWVVWGYKSEKKEPECKIEIRKEHFNPRIGWELKDIVIVGLPQDLRFLVLHDIESRSTDKGNFYLLFVKRSNY